VWFNHPVLNFLEFANCFIIIYLTVGPTKICWLHTEMVQSNTDHNSLSLWLILLLFSSHFFQLATFQELPPTTIFLPHPCHKSTQCIYYHCTPQLQIFLLAPIILPSVQIYLKYLIFKYIYLYSLCGQHTAYFMKRARTKSEYFHITRI
jgi:hypothetical protein